MKRARLYFTITTMVVGAIIAGCAMTAGPGFDPNRGYTDQSEVSVTPNAPAADVPSSSQDQFLILERNQTGIRQNLASGGSIELRKSQPFRGENTLLPPLPQRSQAAAPPAVDIPGSGAMFVVLPHESKPVAIPLKHTDVHANILGYISTVDVTQQYQNPYSEKIEATYVFPLPQDASVSDFVMTIGDRHIRGIIREKAEAERIYNAAKSQGYVATLLTQDRPNIFTQNVANIEPGKQIDVNIKYFNTLQYRDGWYEFFFPMVVGPRFNPPGSTDGIGAAGRGNAGASGQSTEVQYLKPGERSGHDISLSVHIDAGVPIEKIESVNHKITSKDSIGKDSTGGADVVLASDDSIPNKDFVLRYKVAGDHLKSALITQRDPNDAKGGGYFTLMLFPPDSLADLPRTPLEMVFTLDVSGSMTGQPIEQSKAAIRYALTHMQSGDTFQVIRFANSSEPMSPQPIPATPANVQRALQYIQTMQAGGGTMMMEGIKQSLNCSSDESRLRYVAFLTDGYIGNEPEILAEVRKSHGNSRLFSFGVGSSPNRYLLDGMARLGAGTAAYLSLNDDANQVMETYFNRIAHPAMSDIQIDFGGMQVSDVYPARIPDLFVGRPVIVTGRYAGAAPQIVHVKGKVGSIAQQIDVKTNSTESTERSALASVWARAKIQDLSDDALDATESAQKELPTQIKQVALEHGLMSPYTSFVAVDSLQVTAGDHGVSVQVPVPVPDGVRYETTVSENGKANTHAN